MRRFRSPIHGGASVVVYIANGTVWTQEDFVEIFEKPQQVGYRCLAGTPSATPQRSNSRNFCSSICSSFWSLIRATFGAALALCEIARAAAPGGIYGGQGGACSSKRGATFDPLWHSGIFPDPTFFEKSRFLKNGFRLKIVSKIDLAGSRRSLSDFSAFLKNAGQYSPQRSLRQRGAPHLEPLLYSARFACPGMLILPILSTLARRAKH